MSQLNQTIMDNKNRKLRDNVEIINLLELIVAGLSICFCIVGLSLNPNYKIELLGIVMVLFVSYSLLMVISQYTDNPYYSSFLDFIS